MACTCASSSGSTCQCCGERWPTAGTRCRRWPSAPLSGAVQGIMQLAPSRPQTQTSHDPVTMIKTVLTINNKLGLHARASAKLTKLASSFASDVHLSRGGRRVNAKSIMGVMMLAAGQGAEIETGGRGHRRDASGRIDCRIGKRQIRGRTMILPFRASPLHSCAATSAGACGRISGRGLHACEGGERRRGRGESVSIQVFRVAGIARCGDRARGVDRIQPSRCCPLLHR